MKTRRPTARKPTSNAIPARLAVGRIAGLFGVKGEVKCDPTSAGRMLFTPGSTLSLIVAGDSRDLTIRSVREHKERLLVAFEGYDAKAAEALAGETLYADTGRIQLAPNEFFDRDLEGCALYDEGRYRGVVERVDHHPTTDMLVVGGKLVPLIDAFIVTIDIAQKRIDARLPAGLLEED